MDDVLHEDGGEVEQLHDVGDGALRGRDMVAVSRGKLLVLNVHGGLRQWQCQRALAMMWVVDGGCLVLVPGGLGLGGEATHSLSLHCKAAGAQA